MEKKINVPALRFRGFNGPWEKKKIHDIAKIVGGGTPSTLEPNYWGGDIDWYTPAEMEGMRYAEGSERKLTTAGLKNSGAKLLPADRTILFTSRAGIGKMAVLKKTAATNQGFQSLVLGAHNNPYFFYSMGTIITKMAEAVASGSTFLEISGKKLGELAITIPDVEEQSKVADLFVSFDDLLEAQEQKIKKLEQFRQAMLTKLFPAEGASEPALRFGEYSGPWKKQVAGKIFLTQDDRNHPELPVLTATQEYGMLYRDDLNYNVSHDKKNEVGYKRVQPGQFVIHLRSFQGGFAHSPLEGITSPAYTVLDFQNRNDHYDYFWKYVLSSAAFIRRLTTVTYGIRDGRSISYKDFCELEFSFPEKAEQVKIGNFFRQLDSYISLQKEKLEKLRRLKAALLDKLFV